MNQSSTQLVTTIAGLLAAFAATKGFALTPEQAISLVAAVGGVAAGAGHVIGGWIHNDKTPVLPPPVVKALLIGFLALPLVHGCASTPTANQQAGIAVGTDIAVGLAVQQGSNDPAVWKARAAGFKAIAVTLQGLNQSGALTLQTLAADLQPLIIKLGPADVLAANALIAALTPFLQQQIDANPSVASARVIIGQFLSTVIAACAAYGA